MKKIFLAAVIVLVVLVVVLSIVLAGFYDSDAVGRALLAQAGKATGLRLTAQEFDLRILSGLEMAGVVAEGDSSAGKYRLKLQRLVFKHRLRPLLSGTIAIDKILLMRPDVLLISRTSGKAPTAEAQQGTPEEGGFRLEVAEIEVIDGRLRVQAPRPAGPPEDRLLIEGLGITLDGIELDQGSGSAVQRLSGEGEIVAHRVLLGELPIRDVDAQIATEGGVIKLTGVSLSTDQGDLEATLQMNLNRVPFQYEFSARGDPVNVNEIVGLGTDGSLGPGRLTLKGNGRGPESRHLKAAGVLHLESGEVPAHPVLEQVQDIVGIEHLVGSEYQATDANLEVTNNRVNLEEFAMETAEAGLDIGGWADLAGPLQMKIVLRTPREGLSIPNVPPVVLDTLEDEKGWVKVPLLVTGTPEDPEVAPDLEELASQGIKGAIRSLGDLFGGGRR